MANNNRVQVIFKWFDMWVGFFWDSKKKWLYFFPIPMLGIIFKFEKRIGRFPDKPYDKFRKQVEDYPIGIDHKHTK